MVDFKIILSDRIPGVHIRSMRPVPLQEHSSASASVTRSTGVFSACGLQDQDHRWHGQDRHPGTPRPSRIRTEENPALRGRRVPPVIKGQRRRKSVRGNEISADFVQINAVVQQRGAKPLTEYFEEPKAAAE